MMLIDGQPGDTISARDRGLSYGDGLFETICFVDEVARFGRGICSACNWAANGWDCQCRMLH